MSSYITTMKIQSSQKEIELNVFDGDVLIRPEQIRELNDIDLVMIMRNAAKWADVIDAIETAQWIIDEWGSAGPCDWDSAYAKLIKQAPYSEKLCFLIAKIDALVEEKHKKEQRRLEKSPKARPGFVYILKGPDGTHKIGRAVNVEKRMTTFGVQLPFPIELEHIIPSDNYQAAEYKLHMQYNDKKVNGEWFALTPEDINEIKMIERL